MKKTTIWVSLALFALAATIMGATTIDRIKSNRDPGTADDKIVLNWTTDSATSVTLTKTIPAVRGGIKRITINPATAAPTAAYDIDLTDEDGCPIIDGTNAGGLGLNLSATATTTFWPSVTDASGNVRDYWVDGDLTYTVKNAGSGKSGKTTIYF